MMRMIDTDKIEKTAIYFQHYNDGIEDHEDPTWYDDAPDMCDAYELENIVNEMSC